MCTGQNVFVTGDAGTGKSFLINTFIAHQRNQKRNVIVCAPTGVAAININGATIHKTFKIKATDQGGIVTKIWWMVDSRK